MESTILRRLIYASPIFLIAGIIWVIFDPEYGAILLAVGGIGVLAFLYIVFIGSREESKPVRIYDIQLSANTEEALRAKHQEHNIDWIIKSEIPYEQLQIIDRMKKQFKNEMTNKSDEEIITRIQSELTHADIATRVRHIIKFTFLKDRRSIQPLIDNLNTMENIVRAANIRALGEIDVIEAIEPIKKLLETEQEDYIRFVAFEVLERLEKSLAKIIRKEQKKKKREKSRETK
jgi:hypothetical protein